MYENLWLEGSSGSFSRSRMGQLQLAVDHGLKAHGRTMISDQSKKMKEQKNVHYNIVPRRSSGRPIRSNYLVILSLLSKLMVLIGTSIALILIPIYTDYLASLQFFWLTVMPSSWTLFSSILTPRNLFIVFNLLVLMIWALAHLRVDANSRPYSHDVSAARPGELNHSADLNSAVHCSSSDQQEMRLEDEEDDEDDGDDCMSTASADSDIQKGTRQIDMSRGQRCAVGAFYSQEIMKLKDDCAENDNAVYYDCNVADNRAEENAAMPDSAVAGNTQSCASAEKMDSHRRVAEDEAGEIGRASGKAEKARNAEYGSDHESSSSAVKEGQLIDSIVAQKESFFTQAQAQESRPLASARFTRKKAATTTTDRAHSPLRISKPILKRGETLDATWKAICESKRQSSPFNRHRDTKRHSSPLNRQYPKHTAGVEGIHEGVPARRTHGLSSPSPLSPMKQRNKGLRNVSHNDELTQATPLQRKREPSIPQEELNAKVESFISRFNAQIRMQREKSLRDFMEMVGRGAR